MLKMMAKQVANPAVKELIEEVQDALAKETSPERLRQDRRLADKIDNLRKILNV
jgi:hypothetical protein